ncbi:MAG: metalloregulator ArsR/SmtB family transcription factor [Gemmatimonadaceae bacterium]|nr:metalloregulator ArsR/SmtB family transcription factor [Gemmatimonadaceae bacterium]
MQLSRPIPLFDRMTALADSTRSRLLLLLERHQLTVNELRSVLQLPQSTVSRHLKVLGDNEWVASSPEGTSRRYRAADKLDSSSRRLWHLVREQIVATPAAAHDARRVQTVLAHRRSRSQRFFSSAATQWDHLRTELFGKRADLLGLMGLLDDRWTVGDLGCGTGQLSESVAPFVSRVVAVDDSAAMLSAARKRLGAIQNVDVRSGRLEALPIDDGSLDAALLFLVLHYVPEPQQAVAEAFRVLKPGGRLLIVDMMPHDREDLLQEMGHVWRGFSEKSICGLFESSGFTANRYHSLPADEAAKGPTLFAAVARRDDAQREAIADAEAGATRREVTLNLSA